MKLLKVTALIVVFVFAALLVVPFLIPKDVALRWVTGAIEGRTPLTIALQDIDIAFLPRPSVSLEGVDVKIKSPDNGNNSSDPLPLFNAASVRVASQWNLIWARQPALDVELNNADIHLLATGPESFNYTPLMKGSQTQTYKTGWHKVLLETAWAEEVKTIPAGKPGFSLDRLELRDSRVHYQAWQEKKQSYPIESLVIEDVQQSEQATSFHAKTRGALEQLKYELDIDAQITKTAAEAAAWQDIVVTSDETSLQKPLTVSINNEKIDLRARFRKAGNNIEFEKGQLQIGPQSLTFNGVRQENGALDLKVQLPTIHMEYLKRILPPVAALPPIKNPSASLRYQTSGTKSSSAAISGSLKADEIQLPEYTLSNVSGDLFYREPRLELKNLKGQALDGTFGGHAEITLAGEKPQYRFDLSLQNVAIEKFGSVGKLLTGRGDMTLNAHGQGFEKIDWSRNLDGNGDVNLRQLQLKQLQPFATLFASPAWQVVNKLPGLVDTKALAVAKKLDGQVRDLASGFRIEGGVLHIPKVKLNFPQASANFSGGIGLDKTLDFNGTLSIDEKLLQSLIKDERLRKALLAGGNSLDIPTKITGTASQPLIQPDAAIMQQRVQTYLTKQVHQETSKALQEKLFKPKKPAGETDKQEPDAHTKSKSSPLKDIQDLIKKPNTEND